MGWKAPTTSTTVLHAVCCALHAARCVLHAACAHCVTRPKPGCVVTCDRSRSGRLEGVVSTIEAVSYEWNSYCRAISTVHESLNRFTRRNLFWAFTRIDRADCMGRGEGRGSGGRGGREGSFPGKSTCSQNACSAFWVVNNYLHSWCTENLQIKKKIHGMGVRVLKNVLYFLTMH